MSRLVPLASFVMLLAAGCGEGDQVRQYRVAYGELVKLLPHNLKKVRSFFRHERASGQADEAMGDGTAGDASTVPSIPAQPPASNTTP